MKRNFFTYIILSSILIISCGEKNKTIKRSTLAMGTMMEIQIRGVDEEIANAAINESFMEIRRLDTLFSTYISGNEMWRINNSKSDTIKVNDEIFSILKICGKVWEETGGAFDPAVGNLIDIVGFEKGSPHLPSPDQIKEALKQIGWKQIQIKEPNILIKPVHVKLSFNACIPGYAADRVASILFSKGIKNFLVNAGGEIFANGDDWKIGIQHPRKKNELLYSVKLNGISISTSGDYQQFFNQKGKRYTHIFNPVTGYPANECEAVTVIAKDAIISDALSTGIFVLGPKRGLEIIEKIPGVEALIVDTTGVVHQSSGFEKYLLR